MRRVFESFKTAISSVFRGVFRVPRFFWQWFGPEPGRSGLKRWMLQIAILGVVAAVGGFLFAASGIAPIGASSGHWPVTEWFLNFSMKRSVSTHSLGIVVPNLKDRGLILRGAGHYETGCLPCHGSPATKRPWIAGAMTPVPPYLPPVIHEWNSEELFYIVKHGVRFTGMPAWPAQTRDDEVWAMVAFLNEFPKLDAQEYGQLVRGGAKVNDEAAAVPSDNDRQGLRQAVIDNCRRCHGSEGEGIRVADLPKLAGQKSAFLSAALQAYAHGERHSGIMQPIAANLSRDEIRQLAQYYSVLATEKPVAGDSLGADPTAIQRGKTISQEGIPAQRVPRCAECHSTDGESRNPHYPNLAGQFSDYLVLQLELFQKRHRGGSPYAKLMFEAADRLTPHQMRDVALYYESLKLPTTAQPAQRSPEN